MFRLLRLRRSSPRGAARGPESVEMTGPPHPQSLSPSAGPATCQNSDPSANPAAAANNDPAKDTAA